MSREDLLFLIKKKKAAIQRAWRGYHSFYVKLVSKAQHIKAHQKSTIYWTADCSTISP